MYVVVYQVFNDFFVKRKMSAIGLLRCETGHFGIF